MLHTVAAVVVTAVPVVAVPVATVPVAAVPVVATGVVEPTGPVTTISAGNYTISSNGVYELAAGYTGTVTIAAGVQDVKIRQTKIKSSKSAKKKLKLAN